MKSKLMRLLCRALVVSMALAPLQAAQAGMIGPAQVAAAASAQSDRNAVLAALNRADVAAHMQSMGVNPASAKARIAAMTDEEVRALAGNLDTLPAGAGGWEWAVVIIVAVVVWYNWK